MNIPRALRPRAQSELAACARLLLVLIFLSVAWVPPAAGCRCPQRTLADYYDEADFVAFGRIARKADDQAEGPLASLHLELDVTFDGEISLPFKGDPRGARFLTAPNSAGCGVDPETDRIYLLFASRLESRGEEKGAPQMLITSCNGTRLFDGGSAPDAFVDTPNPFVISRLLALQGLGELRALAARERSRESQKILGLLPLGERDPEGVYRPPDREWTLRTTRRPPEELEEEIGSRESYSWRLADFVTREIGYEEPALVVLERDDFGYRLQPSSSSGAGPEEWISREHEGVHDLVIFDEIPLGRLAYMPRGWSGFSWPEPGAGLPSRYIRGITLGGSEDGSSAESLIGHGAEVPVNVLRSQRIGGSLWFLIEVLEPEPCSGEEPQSIASGWVPGYRVNDEPNVWFYSRGC